LISVSMRLFDKIIIIINLKLKKQKTKSSLYLKMNGLVSISMKTVVNYDIVL
jgi:hypothetical protein